MIQKNIDVYKVAGWGLVDDVIDPRDTRRVLAWGLDLARRKQVERPPRKRGIVPPFEKNYRGGKEDSGLLARPPKVVSFASSPRSLPVFLSLPLSQGSSSLGRTSAGAARPLCRRSTVGSAATTTPSNARIPMVLPPVRVVSMRARTK